MGLYFTNGKIYFTIGKIYFTIDEIYFTNGQKDFTNDKMYFINGKIRQKTTMCLEFLSVFFWGAGDSKTLFKPFALAFESMAPAGAIDSNETDFNIPAVSPANGKIYLRLRLRLRLRFFVRLNQNLI